MNPLRIASPVLLGALLLAVGSCSGRSPLSPPAPAARAQSAATAGVTFRVTAPSNTPAGDSVFIAGDFQGWNPRNPAYALTKQLDGRWTITLPLPAGFPIQFKFTRGGWERVEKGSSGEELPNRTLTPDGVSTYDFTVARWENGTTQDSNGNGVDDSIDELRLMRDVLIGQGLEAGVDLESLEAAGHRHNESYWAQRVPGMLRFLVGRSITASVP